LWIVLPKFVISEISFLVFRCAAKSYFSSSDRQETATGGGKISIELSPEIFFERLFISQVTSPHHPPSKWVDAATGFVVLFQG
jgi:hypothetical protein